VNRDSFVTAIYALYNSTDRTLKIARAGHPLPILYRPKSGKAEELACQGVFIMGIEEYPHVPVTTTTLAKGDRFLLYTDGVTERFNIRNQPYGEERICRQLENANTTDSASILSRIIDDLNQFSKGHTVDDDIAMLLAIIT
jgi:sigma-B regulation protein RsbU (phosphoserine phosphatase)